MQIEYTQLLLWTMSNTKATASNSFEVFASSKQVICHAVVGFSLIPTDKTQPVLIQNLILLVATYTYTVHGIYI